MYRKGSVETLALMATLAWAAAGCGSNTSMGPGSGSSGSASVSLSFSAGGSGGTPAVTLPGGSFDLMLGDGQSNALTITRVALVLREIELKLQDELCEDSSDGVDSDKCEEFETGPRLFELPMDGSTQQVLQVSDVPAGTYEGVELNVHKPDSQNDQAFIAANPSFADVSIRVEGTFNGNAFTYLTDLNEEQEVTFATPLVIGATDTAPVNVTLLVDVDGWFRDASGTLVDPVSANKGGVNENLVKDNIRSSLEGFEDDDHDGIED